MSNFFKVQTLALSARNKAKGKPIGNNLRAVVLGNGDVAIRLHATNIVVYHNPNNGGGFTLNSGGWHTVTTKKRMNQYMPDNMGIFQRNFAWFLRIDGKTVSYRDGMRFDHSGMVAMLPLGEAA